MIMSITAIARSLHMPICIEREGERERELIEGRVGESTTYRTKRERKEREEKKTENCCYTYMSLLSRTEGLKEKKIFVHRRTYAQCHLKERE